MNDYMYGYDSQEFRRLEDQHRIWLSRTREHLKAGDIGPSDIVLDIGCGPGFVATELAMNGIRVLASDCDQLSLDALAARCKTNRISGVHAVPACDALDLPRLEPKPTVAYMRWLLCYLGASKTEGLFRRLSLEPGSRVLVHDFINYRSARIEPPSEVVHGVINTFFERITDADIGFALPAILDRCGFRLAWKRVIALAISPKDYEWAWPDQFFTLHVPRLGNADAFFRDWGRAAGNPGALFYSWPVLQLVAVKE